MTPNEVREELGMPPRPEPDTIALVDSSAVRLWRVFQGFMWALAIGACVLVPVVLMMPRAC